MDKENKNVKDDFDIKMENDSKNTQYDILDDNLDDLMTEKPSKEDVPVESDNETSKEDIPVESDSETSKEDVLVESDSETSKEDVPVESNNKTDTSSVDQECINHIENFLVSEFSKNSQNITEMFNKLDINNILENQSKIINRLDDLTRYVQFQEKISSNMNDELQKYKRDFYASILKPVFKEIIGVVDNMRRDIISLEAQHGIEDLAMAKKLQFYINNIHIVLSNYGVVYYYTQSVGTQDYKPIEQNIIKRIETDDISKDKKVAQSLLYGYKYNDKVLRAESVSIFKYKK